MEILINYGLYIIGILCVMTPVIAFGVFAPVIAKTTVVGFVINWFAQFFQRIKEGKETGGFFKKIFETGHEEDHSPMWIDNAKPEKHEHHIVPNSVYIGVFVALIILTVITVWVAGFDFGAMNMVIAMLVATTKASLVLLYFMHLKYDHLLNRTIILSSFFFLALLFAFSMGDIISRIETIKTF